MSTFAETIVEASEQLRAAGIREDTRLEAELLLSSATGISREQLIASLGETLDADTRHTFAGLLARRLRREPLAYVTGHREFYGLDLSCRRGALIPRQETELLVDLALREVHARDQAPRIVDVGTGTGAVACAIGAQAPEVQVLAVDSSEAALSLARENVERVGLQRRVEIRRGDLLEGLDAFDVVVANLPYVSESEWRALEPEIRDFEPKEALVPGPLGTEANVRLLAEGAAHLCAGALLALEMGASQGSFLCSMAGDLFPRAQVSVIKDLAGLDRVLVVRWSSDDRRQEAAP